MSIGRDLGHGPGTTGVRDRVAFVTGAGQGIGLGIARALAAGGARLALIDIDAAQLESAAAELGAVTDVASFTLDVRDRAAYAAVAGEVEAQLGHVSLLFNNAGVANGASPRRVTFADWDWVLGVNLQGVVNGIQTFMPTMIERGDGGYIVNTASGAGLVGLGTDFLYVTSKFAVVGLSESLHVKLAKYGIGVSVLCPGPVDTNILANSERLRSDQSDRHVRTTDKSDLLKSGVSPDTVGRMVLDAMAAGRLYIHTDDVMEQPIKVRTQLLLDALPSALASLA